MKIFSSVLLGFQHYMKTNETCAAIYPIARKTLALSTTKRQHSAVLYKDGADIRFTIDRVGN